MSAGAGDIASLGLAIDATPIRGATAALREFAGAAGQAQGKTQQVQSATDSLIAALNRNTSANASQTQSLASVTSALNQTISALNGLVERQRQVQAAEAATASALDRTTTSHRQLAAATTATDAATNSHVTASRAAAAADAEQARQVESLTDKLRQLSAARAQAIVQSATGSYGQPAWTAQAGYGGPTIAPPNHVPAGAAPVAGNNNTPAPTPMPARNDNGWSAMRAEIDPVWASQERLNQTIEAGNKLLASGAITQEVYNRAVNAATQRHQDLTEKVDAQTRSVGLNRHEWTNLGYQLNDATTMGLMGASPFQIVTSQGGQVLQTLAGSAGGITGALKAMGEAVAAGAARIGVLGGVAAAAATAIAGITYATFDYRSQSDALKRTTFGAGEASGATVADMQRAASSAAAGGKISAGDARDVIGQLNAMGTVDPNVYASAAESAGRLAKALNVDLSEASSQVVGALTNGVRGFDTLNERLLLVNGSTRQQIADLYDAGQAYKAQEIIVDALAKKLRDLPDERGWARRLWEGTKSGAAGAYNAVGEFFSPGYNDPAAQLSAARNRLSNMDQRQGTLAAVPAREYAEARAEVERLERAMAKTADGGKDAKTTLQSLTVAPLVESLNPAQKRIDDITKQADLIQKYLDEGGSKLDKDGQARRTMEGLRAQAEQLTAELAKGGSSLANGLQAAQFNLSQVGFSDYARQRNQLEENARIERQAVAASNQEPAKRDALIKAIDEKLAVAVKALDQQTILAGQSAATTGGGRYSRTVADAPASWQPFILQAARESGFNPDLISSMLYRESRYNMGLTSKAGAKGPAQFMPGTAAEMGVDVNDLGSSILGMGRYMRKIAGIIGSSDEVDVASAYNRGPGAMQKWIAAGRNPLKIPEETQGYTKEIFGGRVGTQEAVKEIQDRNRALKTQAEAERMTAEANGRDTESLQARIEVMQQVSNAQARNQEVTADMLKQFQEEAAVRAKLATQSRLTAYNIQTGWDRDQIGFDRQNQTARSMARSVTGSTDMTTPQAQKIIGESLNNQAWLEAKNMTTEGLTSLASQLRQGATFAQAFNNALDRTVDKLISSALDTAVSGVFKGLQGSMGTGGLDLAKLWPFANGGVMTATGAMQLRTYARGGVADRPQLAMYGEAGPEAYVPLPDGRRIPVAMQGSGAGGAPAQGANPVAVINMTGQPTETRTVDGPRGPRTEVLIGKGIMSAVASGELDGVLRDRFGVRPLGR